MNAEQFLSINDADIIFFAYHSSKNVDTFSEKTQHSQFDVARRSKEWRPL